MSEWEEVTENTWRLELDAGHLYRYGEQMVFVPDDVSQSFYDISETLGELRLLFEETTFNVNGKDGIRAIRNSDIGN